jgi:hypothetical protein
MIQKNFAAPNLPLFKNATTGWTKISFLMSCGCTLTFWTTTYLPLLHPHLDLRQVVRRLIWLLGTIILTLTSISQFTTTALIG